MTPTLVLTRPDAQSRAIAVLLGAEVPVIVSPVMRIVAAGAAPDMRLYSGVILTSANALAHAPELHGKPAYCVGQRTAEAAGQAGADVRLVAKDAADLVARFEGQGKLVHLRGEHARGNIAERLSSAGIETDEAVVYRQEELPLSGEAKAAIEGARPVVLPLYSPRSARLVGGQVAKVGRDLKAIAMSEAVAEAWQAATGASAQVVARPTGEDMLTAIRAALSP